jgi:eukaryotic-like serine/threonine-protein kinase
MDLRQGGSVIGGRYRLERLLARGGMGEVWVAQHLHLDVYVAIKFILPAFTEDAHLRTRFEREAKICAKLKSPHVARVHDYGSEGDTPFLVMDLLEGETLETRLHREGHLTLAATQTIVNQVGMALHRMQEEVLVHRDLKPANIFLARQDGAEIVKILDFGVAKPNGLAEAVKVTKTDAVLGTPHYMSPQQVRGKHLDHRSDLWTLGVVVFRCLTGRLPFSKKKFGDLLVSICTEPIPIASQVMPHLGPEVDQFFFRAFKREPERRFQSALEFAEAFAALVGSSEVAPVASVASEAAKSAAAGASGSAADRTSLDVEGSSVDTEVEEEDPRKASTVGDRHFINLDPAEPGISDSEISDSEISDSEISDSEIVEAKNSTEAKIAESVLTKPEGTSAGVTGSGITEPEITHIHVMVTTDPPTPSTLPYTLAPAESSRIPRPGRSVGLGLLLALLTSALVLGGVAIMVFRMLSPNVEAPPNNGVRQASGPSIAEPAPAAPSVEPPSAPAAAAAPEHSSPPASAAHKSLAPPQGTQRPSPPENVPHDPLDSM